MTNFEAIKLAIEKRKPISFEYPKRGPGKRYGKPFALYIFTTTKGIESTKVDIVQTGGVSPSQDEEPFPSWRMPNIEEIENVQILDDQESFVPTFPGYKPNSKRYNKIIAKV